MPLVMPFILLYKGIMKLAPAENHRTKKTHSFCLTDLAKGSSYVSAVCARARSEAESEKKKKIWVGSLQMSPI